MGKPGVFKRINNQDQTITPFKVYKSWRYSTTSSLDVDLERFVAIKPDPTKYAGNKVTLDSWQMATDTASNLVNSGSLRPASMIWYSLNHLYYKRAGKPLETFGYADPYAIERTIFNEASVISIPQKKFGEAVKPGSVKFSYKTTSANAPLVNLIDDGKGNLIDTSLSSSISGEVLYLQTDSTTYNVNWTSNSASLAKNLSSRNIIDAVKVETAIPEYTTTAKNVWFRPNIGFTIDSQAWGNVASFNKNSYIRIPHDESLDFKKSNDFAISFWLLNLDKNYAPGEYSAGDTMPVITKNSTGTGTTMARNRTITTSDIETNSSQYPYNIELATTNGTTYKVNCKQSNGSVVTQISSSIDVTKTAAHVLFQQSGSYIQLYINGAYIVEASVPADGNINNKADTFIGSVGLRTTNTGYNAAFAGDVRNFFIFNKALSATAALQLGYANYSTGDLGYNSMVTNTNAVGNVFYEHGMIAISDPRPKYGSINYRLFNDRLINQTTGLTQSGKITTCSLEYNSTVTLYEHEYICKLKDDEFNFTTNATIRLDNDTNSEVPKSFVANEEFAPYITTIGLYNKNGELLAVGKLGTPIKKRDDVDLNLIVRFDI